MNFPDNFLWGTATSAYQIEGAASEDGRGPSDWDAFSAKPGAIHRGDTASIASDHYHRLDEDLDLLSRLGVNAYRFSISWTRIHPDGTNKVNQPGLDFYNRLIDGLVERGITPLATINHMEVPLALADQGGWLNRDTIDRFCEYADTVHAAFSDRIKHWATMNEIAVTTWWGNGTSWFPPALNRSDLVLPAIHNQLVAHGRATRHMRANQSEGHFGIVGSFWPVLPAQQGPEHEHAARLLDLLINRSALDVLVDGEYPAELLEWHTSVGGADFIQDRDLSTISEPLDYFGLNYYAPFHVLADPAGPGGQVVPPGIGIRQADPAEAPKTSFDWLIDPEALLPVLRQFRDRYKLPVYITENGAAFDDYVSPEGRVNDTERIDYLREHINVLSRAITEGIDIRGYMAWSLLDNFEWASGYSKRFGLTYVDYRTQTRIPKESFHWYHQLITEAQGRRTPSSLQRTGA
ncbi:GH1 family beta-glucosidase [Arthrobacter sp. Z1-9]